METAVDVNDTTTISPNDSSAAPITEAPSTSIPCQYMLYKSIGKSNVRVWDLVIFIPNVLFLLFLVYKSRKAVKKLRRTNSPIFLAFYGLVSLVAVISVTRCIVSMTVNAAAEAGGVADKILWLLLRFFLLATELSVVIFGLAFGHLDSRTSIRRVLMVTFFSALTYSSIQGVLEFLYPDDRFHVSSEDGDDDFDMFGHGGMLFWFISSIFFALIYTVIVILPLTSCRTRFPLPTKRRFYVYCLLLAILNVLQAAGSGLLYFGVDPGLCLVNVTSYLYFTCFAPLVYFTFLRNFFRTVQPQSILFSYKTQQDDDTAADDQLHLPSHTYIPTKNSFLPSSSAGAAGDESLMSQSQDSTHFVGHAQGHGPNPLYDTDMPYTGDHAALSINDDYFAVSSTGSINGPELHRNPIA